MIYTPEMQGALFGFIILQPFQNQNWPTKAPPGTFFGILGMFCTTGALLCFFAHRLVRFWQPFWLFFLPVFRAFMVVQRGFIVWAPASLENWVHGHEFWRLPSYLLCCRMVRRLHDLHQDTKTAARRSKMAPTWPETATKTSGGQISPKWPKMSLLLV